MRNFWNQRTCRKPLGISIIYTQYFFLLLKNKICTQLIFFFKRKLQQLLFKPFFCWRGRFRLNDGFQLKWPKPPKSSALFCLLNFKNSTERLILLMFSEENKNRFSTNGSFFSFHRLTLVHQFWIDWLHLNRSLYSLRFENRMECHDLCIMMAESWNNESIFQHQDGSMIHCQGLHEKCAAINKPMKASPVLKSSTLSNLRRGKKLNILHQ